MISRVDVADLRVGDVVEVRSERWPLVVMRGPLADYRGYLSVGPWAVRNPDGSPYDDLGTTSTRHLTVIERAPRPLYVNHDRTEPMAGDVVRAADDPGDQRTWMYDAAGGEQVDKPWRCGFIGSWYAKVPQRAWLLVDGETGQVVP